MGFLGSLGHPFLPAVVPGGAHGFQSPQNGSQKVPPGAQTWAHLGPKVLNITPRSPKHGVTWAQGAQHHGPEPQNATPKPPQGTKKGANGIENTCVQQTAGSDYRNSRQASSQRYALRPWTPCLQKAASTGTSSQACFVRTHHTASSQGHPSHTPQRIHPISYSKLYHSSTLPLHTPRPYLLELALLLVTCGRILYMAPPWSRHVCSHPTEMVTTTCLSKVSPQRFPCIELSSSHAT